jgi:hypothetical protein
LTNREPDGLSQAPQAAPVVADRPSTGDSPNGSVDAILDQIDALSAEAQSGDGNAVDRRLLKLRHAAALELVDQHHRRPEYPTPAADALPQGSSLPEFAPEELTPELMRAAMLRDGCVLVRGLIDADQAARLQEEIDRAFDAREACRSGDAGPGPYYEDFEPDPRFNLGQERFGAGDASNLWGPDSPMVMDELFATFRRSGFDALASGYLGERPAISVNKCTLRRVFPDKFTDKTPSFWHQDGAFLGDVRALNLWLSLSRCGDTAPGLDIVPRRLEEIVPTGTEGATFDWSVSRQVVDSVAGATEVVRPVFNPGDALLFDELFLHATGADPGMPNTRYAVECWFFGTSAFPTEYAPLVA